MVVFCEVERMWFIIWEADSSMQYFFVRYQTPFVAVDSVVQVFLSVYATEFISASIWDVTTSGPLTISFTQ